MIRITIERRTTKRKGTIKLRFRLRDGRGVQMYYRSNITLNVELLEKITDDGQAKKGVKVIDAELLDSINKVVIGIRNAYGDMKKEGKVLVSENLQREVDRLLCGYSEVETKTKPETLLDRFARYIEDSFKNDVFGKNRRSSNQALHRSLERFLHIITRKFITPKEFDSDLVISFSNFLRNEFEFVSQWPMLYESVKPRDIPKEQRKSTTVAARLKILRAFFSTLAQREEIKKSPFDQIDKNTKKAILRESYDRPISLTLSEIDKIRFAEVPEELQETKAAFLLQCATGCRIGDFKRLTMDNVSVSDEGVPFLHYIPSKTMRESLDEVITPLISLAVEIINKYQLSFSILKNVSGKYGYGQRIKKILKFCELDRPCAIFDEKEKREIFQPLYEIASSKLARKTFVNLAASCQVDMYAAGLHSRNSNAVERYAHIDLNERYQLLCYAFNMPVMKVDKNLRPLVEPGVDINDKINTIIQGLSEEERKILLKLLSEKP